MISWPPQILSFVADELMGAGFIDLCQNPQVEEVKRVLEDSYNVHFESALCDCNSATCAQSQEASSPDLPCLFNSPGTMGGMYKKVIRNCVVSDNPMLRETGITIFNRVMANTRNEFESDVMHLKRVSSEELGLGLQRAKLNADEKMLLGLVRILLACSWKCDLEVVRTVCHNLELADENRSKRALLESTARIATFIQFLDGLDRIRTELRRMMDTLLTITFRPVEQKMLMLREFNGDHNDVVITLFSKWSSKALPHTFPWFRSYLYNFRNVLTLLWTCSSPKTTHQMDMLLPTKCKDSGWAKLPPLPKHKKCDVCRKQINGQRAHRMIYPTELTWSTNPNLYPREILTVDIPKELLGTSLANIIQFKRSIGVACSALCVLENEQNSPGFYQFTQARKAWDGNPRSLDQVKRCYDRISSKRLRHLARTTFSLPFQENSPDVIEDLLYLKQPPLLGLFQNKLKSPPTEEVALPTLSSLYTIKIERLQQQVQQQKRFEVAVAKMLWMDGSAVLLPIELEPSLRPFQPFADEGQIVSMLKHSFRFLRQGFHVAALPDGLHPPVLLIQSGIKFYGDCRKVGDEHKKGIAVFVGQIKLLDLSCVGGFLYFNGKDDSHCLGVVCENTQLFRFLDQLFFTRSMYWKNVRGDFLHNWKFLATRPTYEVRTESPKYPLMSNLFGIFKTMSPPKTRDCWEVCVILSVKRYDNKAVTLIHPSCFPPRGSFRRNLSNFANMLGEKEESFNFYYVDDAWEKSGEVSFLEMPPPDWAMSPGAMVYPTCIFFVLAELKANEEHSLDSFTFVGRHEQIVFGDLLEVCRLTMKVCLNNEGEKEYKHLMLQRDPLSTIITDVYKNFTPADVSVVFEAKFGGEFFGVEQSIKVGYLDEVSPQSLGLRHGFEPFELHLTITDKVVWSSVLDTNRSSSPRGPSDMPTAFMHRRHFNDQALLRSGMALLWKGDLVLSSSNEETPESMFKRVIWVSGVPPYSSPDAMHVFGLHLFHWGSCLRGAIIREKDFLKAVEASGVLEDAIILNVTLAPDWSSSTSDEEDEKFCEKWMGLLDMKKSSKQMAVVSYFFNNRWTFMTVIYNPTHRLLWIQIPQKIELAMTVFEKIRIVSGLLHFSEKSDEQFNYCKDCPAQMTWVLTGECCGEPMFAHVWNSNNDDLKMPPVPCGGQHIAMFVENSRVDKVWGDKLTGNMTLDFYTGSRVPTWLKVAGSFPYVTLLMFAGNLMDLKLLVDCENYHDIAPLLIFVRVFVDRINNNKKKFAGLMIPQDHRSVELVQSLFQRCSASPLLMTALKALLSDGHYPWHDVEELLHQDCRGARPKGLNKKAQPSMKDVAETSGGSRAAFTTTSKLKERVTVGSFLSVNRQNFKNSKAYFSRVFKEIKEDLADKGKECNVADDVIQKCRQCDAPGFDMSRCSLCMVTTYCSEKCLFADRSRHESECNKIHQERLMKVINEVVRQS